MADSLAALSPRQWRSQVLATTRAKIWLPKHKHPTSPIYGKACDNPARKGKSLFLTIQLLSQFGFGHRTPKSGIFDHPTFKTIYNFGRF
jgi:hypothetical protein